MCTTCGCGVGETRIGMALAGKGPLELVEPHAHHDHEHPHAHEHAHDHVHEHVHADGTRHSHPHTHAHHHAHTSHAHHHDALHGEDEAHEHDHGDLGFDVGGGTHQDQQARLIAVEQDILSRNDAVATGNRQRFAAARVLALNLMSSPGAGKTTLLVRTLETLKAQLPIAVIEGDQETAADAERIRATGVPALQVNTGRGCHLDAGMIAQAVERLPLPAGGVLFIENVGNLVCPAGFDLGEAHKVVLASVTEGEDKPLKYPHMFRAADLMLVSKVDLLPYLDFDVDLLIANARKVNPGIAVVKVSTRAADGLTDWLAWISAARTVKGLAAG
jgi:hydrogenase nickel incorporation protein HypB